MPAGRLAAVVDFSVPHRFIQLNPVAAPIARRVGWNSCNLCHLSWMNVVGSVWEHGACARPCASSVELGHDDAEAERSIDLAMRCSKSCPGVSAASRFDEVLTVTSSASPPEACAGVRSISPQRHREWRGGEIQRVTRIGAGAMFRRRQVGRYRRDDGGTLRCFRQRSGRITCRLATLLCIRLKLAGFHLIMASV